MIYGLYLSAQGAQAQQQRLDVVSNNLANADTTGFKPDIPLFRSHLPFDLDNGSATDMPAYLRDSHGGVSVERVETDFSQNSINNTGGKLDVALSGSGFLKVSDGKQTFLTRDGSLTLASDGTLQNQDGMSVLNDLGTAITVSSDAESVEINPSGQVYQTGPAGRTPLGQLSLVEPASYDSLEKFGKNLYQNHGGEKTVGPELQVQQGYLESSGVEPVSEMVQLIETSRAFEANLNLIKYQDEALGTLLSTIPRL